MKNLYQSIMTKNLAYTENRWVVPQDVFLHSTGAGNKGESYNSYDSRND